MTPPTKERPKLRAKPTHTPRRNFRVTDETWEQFGAACEKLGTDASNRLRWHMERDIARAAKK